MKTILSELDRMATKRLVFKGKNRPDMPPPLIGVHGAVLVQVGTHRRY